MILIGLTEQQKSQEIKRYVRENDIKNVIVLSPQKYYIELPDCGCPIRQIEYSETIMYRTFYPLLEEINDKCLIVFNEMCRTSNRADLTYNCCAKYTNQTPHRLVFEYMPIISDVNDIMILIDFDTSQKYKMRGLDSVDHELKSIKIIKRDYTLSHIDIDVPEKAHAAYAQHTKDLFDNIGHSDPDTIPRRLHKWCNRYRKPYVESHPEINFLAGAASEFKCPNAFARKEAHHGEYIMAELPFYHKDWNDLYRDTGMVNIKFLKTPFAVDAVYEQLFNEWRKEIDKIYAETGVYAGDC